MGLASAFWTVLAYHGTQGGGGGSVLLWVFFGLVATAGWLLLSPLRWPTTVSVAAVGWLAGLALVVAF